MCSDKCTFCNPQVLKHIPRTGKRAEDGKGTELSLVAMNEKWENVYILRAFNSGKCTQ